MANRFNPQTNVDTGQEYDFRGVDGNRAWGTLVGGAADILDQGIKAGVRAVGHNIEQDAIAGEAEIQDNLFNTSDVAIAQAATTAGGQALPEDLSRGFKEALRLKNGYVKGALRESDYLANIDVLAKKLRSKYGAQWSAEIDAAIGGAMSNTANKFRKQLFSEWDKEMDNATEASKSLRSFVQKHPDHYAAFPDMFANPENYSWEQHLAVVGPRERKKWDVAQLEAEARLSDHRTKAGQEAMETALNARAQLYLNTFADVAGTPYTKVLYEKIKTMGADEHFSKDEKAELIKFLNAAQADMRIGWNKILSEPGYIKLDPERKKAAQGLIDSEFELWKDMVMNDKTGAMAFNLNRYKAASQDQAIEWLKRDPQLANASQAYSALKELGLGELVEEEMRDYINDNGIVADDGEAGFTLFAQGLLGPDVINEFSERLYKGEATDGGVKAFVKGVDYTVKALVDDRTPVETRRRAGAALFSPSSRMFLSHFSDVPGKNGVSHREQLYYHIITPGTIAAMGSLKTTDHTSWFNFYTWAVDESFNVLFKQDFDQALADRDLRGIKFDPQTAQFKQSPTPTKAVRGSEDQQRVEQKAYDRKFKQTERELARLNTWIQRVRPIIEADGLPAEAELRRIFEARGWTNILNLLPIEEDVTNEANKKNQKKESE